MNDQFQVRNELPLFSSVEMENFGTWTENQLITATVALKLRTSNMAARSCYITWKSRNTVYDSRHLSLFVVPSIALSLLSKKSNNEDLTNPPLQKSH